MKLQDKIKADATNIIAAGEARGYDAAELRTLISAAHDILIDCVASGRHHASRTVLAEVAAWVSELEDRTPATTVPTAAPAATPGQVDYLVDLLCRRTLTGEGGGFIGTDRYVTAEGRIDRAALAGLTRDHASQMITSLKGAY